MHFTAVQENYKRAGVLYRAGLQERRQNVEWKKWGCKVLPADSYPYGTFRFESGYLHTLTGLATPLSVTISERHSRARLAQRAFVRLLHNSEIVLHVLA